MKLEDLYSRAKIHDYIRDHGIQKDFDPEQLAREIGMNPKNIKLLYNLGFFDRDIQVYSNSYNRERKKLADELKHEIEKLQDESDKRKENFRRDKFITYGGRTYNRRTW